MSGMDALRGAIILNIADAVDKQIDGRELTKQIEIILEKELGDEIAKKLERGLFFNLILEMAAGLYEDTTELYARIDQWKADNLKKQVPTKP